MATSLHAHYDEIDQILGTWAVSCPHVVVARDGGGSSAADVDVAAFEEWVIERKARIRERAGTTGQNQGQERQVQRKDDFHIC